MGLVTLTFDRLTLKLVCESHLRWGSFLPSLRTLFLWFLELFAMYATDGQTDRQKQRLSPLPYWGGCIIITTRALAKHNIHHMGLENFGFGDP